MKPLSTDQAARPTLPRQRSGGLTEPGVTVRPARLDRPLNAGSISQGYVDPYLDDVVRRAADEARQAARAEGYAAGWAEGRRAAAQVQAEESAQLAEEATARRAADAQRARTLLAALGAAVQGGRRPSVPQWHEVADTLAEGAAHLARAILGRELRSVDSGVLELVRAALRAVAEPDGAVVHLNPQDAADLTTAGGPSARPTPTARGGDPADAEHLSGVRIVPDPAVAPGAVMVLTPAQRLQLDLPAALAAAEEVLRS